MTHSPPNAVRRSCAVTAALAAFALPVIAHAEPISILGAYPQRASASGAQSTRQPRAEDDYAGNAGINRADCESDEQWSWSFTLPAAAIFSTLEVWASADTLSCADPSTRAGSGPTPRCWKAASFAYAAVANGGVVKLASSDVIKAGFRMKNVDDASLTAKADICQPGFDMQPSRVYLHFLAMDAAGQAVGGVASNPYESFYQTTYDLRGPDAPATPTLAIGALYVDLTWPTSTPVDKDFVGYVVYCTPGGPAPTPDAGEGAPGCADLPSQPRPEFPTKADEARRCATGSAYGASIASLQPGVGYSLRFAALDRYGNTGPLSKQACFASITGPRDYAPTEPANGGCALGGTSARAGTSIAALLALGAFGLAARARGKRTVPAARSPQ